MTLSKDPDPFDRFESWFADARAAEPDVPDAAALATADETGMPDVRMVLVKAWGAGGFVVYTNMESAKGRQMTVNPKAALCFHWKSLKRQVRVQGPVELVSDDEADAYFNSRDRGSRIGAWASQQSRPLEGRFALEKAAAKYAAKYAIGHVPRPAYWTGMRILPSRIEFWQQRDHRLHDRLAYTRKEAGWETAWLYP